MNRSAVLGLFVLLLAGLGLLYFLVVRDSPAATPEPAAPTTTGSGGGGGTTTASGTPRQGPALTSTRPGEPTATDPPATDGMTLHDMRGSAGEDVVIAGTGEDRRGRRLDPGLVRTLHRNAEAMVVACAKKVPAADRGPAPRIDLKLKVAITGGSLRVTEATPELEDLAGPELATAKTCVQSAMMGLEVPAPDEADLDTYDLHYRYVVR